jgi:ABC-type nitrate/sulfonate/bicarbonate transport system substrate-binding protein
MKTIRNRGAFLVIILILSLEILSGCSKKKNANTSTLINPFGGEKLAELKISAEDWAYIAEAKGWLNESFGKYGIKVTLVQGVSGNEVQLFSRGDVHFTFRMMYPYLLYRTQGADFIAVDVSKHPEPDIASVYVLTESTYQTFDDLKGKKIASWRASCPYMVLFELTERRNWVQGKDWTFISIPSGNNKNALLSKEVAAVSGHLSGDVAPLIVDGLAREIAYPSRDSLYINGGGVTVIFTTSDFAKKYPKITEEYVFVRRKTEHWMLTNLDEGAAIIEEIKRVPPQYSKFVWLRSGSTWESSDLDLATIQKQTKELQDWLIDHGDIDADKQVDPALLFDSAIFSSIRERKHSEAL